MGAAEAARAARATGRTALAALALLTAMWSVVVRAAEDGCCDYELVPPPPTPPCVMNRDCMISPPELKPPTTKCCTISCTLTNGPLVKLEGDEDCDYVTYTRTWVVVCGEDKKHCGSYTGSVTVKKQECADGPCDHLLPGSPDEKRGRSYNI